MLCRSFHTCRRFMLRCVRDSAEENKENSKLLYLSPKEDFVYYSCIVSFTYLHVTDTQDCVVRMQQGLQAISADTWPLHVVMGLQVIQFFSCNCCIRSTSVYQFKLDRHMSSCENDQTIFLQFPALNSPPTVILDRCSITARKTEYACGNATQLLIAFLLKSQTL